MSLLGLPGAEFSTSQDGTEACAEGDPEVHQNPSHALCRHWLENAHNPKSGDIDHFDR
jgi:hypothetical protein